MPFDRFNVADDGGGVDVFVDRKDDLGDAFMGEGFTKRSVIKENKKKTLGKFFKRMSKNDQR